MCFQEMIAEDAKWGTTPTQGCLPGVENFALFLNFFEPSSNQSDNIKIDRTMFPVLEQYISYLYVNYDKYLCYVF